MKNLLILISCILLLLSSNVVKGQDHPHNKFYIAEDGVAIHFEVLGKGEPLILLHGLGSDFRHNWQKVYPELVDNFKIIGVDIRGHGNSGTPHDKKVYGDALVNDVVGLMDHLSIKESHIAGYSLGGWIALKVASDHPNKIKSLVLGGSGLLTPPMANAISQKVSSGLSQAESVSQSVIERYPPGSIPESFIKQLESNDKYALAALMSTAGVLGIPKAKAKNIMIPTLAISGESDKALPTAKLLGQLNDNVSVVKLEGENHLSAPLDPRFHKKVENFLLSTTK